MASSVSSFSAYGDRGRDFVTAPFVSTENGRGFSYFEKEPDSRHLNTTSYVSGSTADVGIGVSVEQGPHGITYVGGIIPGGPADLEGIKCGDAILQIDGASVFGMNPAQILRRLHGTGGTPVLLKIGQRPFHFERPINPDQIRTVKIVRSGAVGTILNYPVASTPTERRSGVLDLEVARDAFRQFDADKNGWISQEEYGSAMRALGFLIEPRQAAEFFNSIDRDNNEQINEAEFLAWYTMNYQVLAPPQVSSFFQTSLSVRKQNYFRSTRATFQ